MFVAMSTRKSLQFAADSFENAKKRVVNVTTSGQLVFENLEEGVFWLFDGTQGIFKGDYHVLFLGAVLKNTFCIISYLVSTGENSESYEFLWKHTKQAVRDHTGVNIKINFCLGDMDKGLISFASKHQECTKLSCYTHTEIQNFLQNPTLLALLKDRHNKNHFASDMQRVRRMPTTNFFDAGIREMHKYWSQQEPEFTK